MGNTMWVQLKQGRKKLGGNSDNSIMLRLQKNLDALARKLNVRELSEFYDYSVLAAEFGEASLKVKEIWSDPSEALRSLEAINKQLQDHFEDLDFNPDHTNEQWPSLLMEELEYCISMLKTAVANKQKFRFVIIP